MEWSESELENRMPGGSDTLDVDMQHVSVDLSHRYPPPCFINRLPVETLSHIFKACEDEDRIEYGWSLGLHETAAYRFCHVHTYWRHVALSTPEIWSCIAIRDDGSLRRALNWLPRTKASPLYLKITANYNVYDTTVDEAMKIFEPHVGRMATMYVQINTIGDTMLHWTPPRMTGLVQLALDGIRLGSASQVLNLLRACPKLETLYMTASSIPRFQGIVGLVPVMLPRLKFISLPLSPKASYFLPYLEIPALVYFALGQELSYEEMRRDRYAYRAGKSFEDTRFKYNTIRWLGSPLTSANRLLDYLRCFPQVEVLMLVEMFHVRDVVHFLNTVDEEGRFPCPRLRVLGFYRCVDWHGSLLGFEPRYRGLTDRACKVPPPLQRLIMEGCPSSEDDVKAKVMFAEFGTAVIVR